MWIFGYGSLIWRPDLPFVESLDGIVKGWTRRFWQGSADHRGVPGDPGRVVTLVPHPGAHCWGRAYRVAPEHIDETLARLDHREKGGYSRHSVSVTNIHGDVVIPDALIYVAQQDNPDWLGPAPLPQIAAQIRRCVGPSGPNDAYLTRLAEALRQMGAEDPHVFELDDLVRGTP